MATTQDFRLGDWRIRPDTHELVGPGETRQLKPRTMEVLVHLAHHAGEVRTRDEVLAAVWGDAFVGEEVLTHCVWELRQALGDSGRKKRFIRTIHRKGYQLIAPVAWIDAEHVPRPVDEEAAGEETVQEEAVAVRTAEPAAVIRRWPAPELPARPYPVLLPYTHPALLAGRENELAELRLRLRRPIPILGLSAPSGTGKSSLLLGGLVPELRADLRADGGAPPVALLRHPQEADLVRRLLDNLVEGGPPPEDDEDWNGFVERLAEIEKLAGMPPILVLDQFEEVLRPGAARARAVLGPLMAASVRRRPGTSEPLCHWLLAYRQDFLGELTVWLRDVLADARATKAGVEALPHDLGGPQRFHSMTLLPLGTPSGGGDALDEARQVFEAAILKPLAIRSADGERRYPWHFSPGHAERLAGAFAEARLEQPDAPLGPELQVTLGHLLEQAGDDGLVEVDDTSRLLDQALEDHLRRALAAVFPSGERGAAVHRARALLALRELASADHDAGLPVAALSRAVGEDGERVLTELATPRSRLVVFRDAPEGMRCLLSHGRLAAPIGRLVEEEGRRGKLQVDADLLALRRLIALKVAHHQSRDPQATRLSERHFRAVAAHSEAFLWDDATRAWWATCRRRRRLDRLRSWLLVAALLAVFAGVGGGVVLWTEKRHEDLALTSMVVHGEPPAALEAFDRLVSEDGDDAVQLTALLRRRKNPYDVLEASPPDLDGDAEARRILRFVSAVLPWVEETPDDPVLIASLVHRLDFLGARDPRLVVEARALRERVLEGLRRQRPPPDVLEDAVPIPAGEVRALHDTGFLVDRELAGFHLLRHEVTAADLRRLWPEKTSDGDDWPVWVNWYEAATYAAWLGGRLPTEAEWAYAARAGCPADYCQANGDAASLDDVGWWSGNSRDTEGRPQAHPVMRLAPNPWGLFDMAGNANEWTATGGPGFKIVRGSKFHSSSMTSGLEERFLWPMYNNNSVLAGFRVLFPEANVAPGVFLRMPVDGETLPSGAGVTLRAEALDVDGTVASVRFSFHRGAEVVGETAGTSDADAESFGATWTNVPDGCYVVRAEAWDDAGAKALDDAVLVVGSCPQQPHGGRPAAIPGIIEAEDFDLGLPGEAYFDTDSGNTGRSYREHTDVDIQIAEGGRGGWNVGWVDFGEWAEYTVDVAAAGEYELLARVAALAFGGTFHVEFDGVDKTGPITVPMTGGWQAWQTVSATVHLDAGVQVMRWQNAEQADPQSMSYNLDAFSLRQVPHPEADPW